MMLPLRCTPGTLTVAMRKNYNTNIVGRRGQMRRRRGRRSIMMLSSTMATTIIPMVVIITRLWTMLDAAQVVAVVSGEQVPQHQPRRQQRKRPSLVNTRMQLEEDFGGGGRLSGNGQAMSFDGTFIIKRISQSRWETRALRPQNIGFDDQGIPKFDDFLSPVGSKIVLSAGENALAICFATSGNGTGPAPKQYYTVDGSTGNIVYNFYIIDSMMETSTINTTAGGSGVANPLFIRFRRRDATIIISNPFTPQAEIAYFNISTAINDLQLLRTLDGQPVYGIEPTVTSDGKLLVFQGHPWKHDAGDKSSGDILMYSYNTNPCAVDGWSKPRMLHQMHTDSNAVTDLKRYPLSWNPLKAPIGQQYDDNNPLRGAYAWLDPEGRFALFAAVRFSANNTVLDPRREAVSLIGSDTLWTTYNIDGGINDSRWVYERLFFSSPMWSYEQERHLAIITGGDIAYNTNNNQNDVPILPVTKKHDVIPFFGTNTIDYNEVDVGDITDPFYIVSLPMNELITIDGRYDLRKTPDLSGFHSVGTLIGSGGYLAWNNALSSSWSGLLNDTHAKGRVLVLRGRDGLHSKLLNPVITSGLSGFTLQMYINPDEKMVTSECPYEGFRYLLHIPDTLLLVYDPLSKVIQLQIVVNGVWITIGYLPVPVGRWSHIAYSWDGVSGEFREYIDGVPTVWTLPTNVFGTLNFASQDLFVGTNSSLDNLGQAPICNGFVGRVDEVRLYSHARSGRSICHSTHGTSCADWAITDTPTIGQSILSSQHPECDKVTNSNSVFCQRALHRVCAQTGATHALASATNLWRTIQQLIGKRPPVSMAGIITDVSTSDVNFASVSCVPMPQQSVAVTFEELSVLQSECKSEKYSHTVHCLSAAKRFCSRMGWDTGVIFEVTTRAWVTCFQADEVIEVPVSTSVYCRLENPNDYECRFEVSSFCKSKGYDAGLIQEFVVGVNGDALQIHCFHASTLEEYPFRLS